MFKGFNTNIAPKKAAILILIAACVIGMQVACVQASGPLPDYHNIRVRCANDGGIAFDENHDGTYYIQAVSSPGMGLNAVHITTDPSASMGQVTTSSSQSGVFYVTDTGGRGYEDDIVLMLAVNGTIPDSFSVHIKTSGYTWAPLNNIAPPLQSITYHTVAIDETFTKDDLIYGPQNWKPTGGDANYPLFVGENMSSPANMFYIMFIDSCAGALGTNYPGSSGLVNKGAVKVEYTFTNLTTYAAFNLYGWNYATNQGQGMHWTNRILPAGGAGAPNGGSNNNPTSGFSVKGVPAPSSTPTPVPKGNGTATPTVTPTPTIRPNATATVTAMLNVSANGTTVTPVAGRGNTSLSSPSVSPAATSTGGGGVGEIPSPSYLVSLLLFAGTALLVEIKGRNKK